MSRPPHSMEITVQLTNQAIKIPAFIAAENTGAVAEFSGIVRGEENRITISGLRYEAYESMAIREIRRLLEELAVASPCHRASVIHRHGWIPVGETAIWIRVEAKHRKEAFALLAAFMDRLKLDVPIWKVDTHSDDRS